MDNGGSSERVEVVAGPSLKDKVVGIAEKFSPGLGEVAKAAVECYDAARAVPGEKGTVAGVAAASLIALENAASVAVDKITNVPTPGGGLEGTALNLPSVDIPNPWEFINENPFQMGAGVVLASVIAGGLGGAFVGYKVSDGEVFPSVLLSFAGMAGFPYIMMYGDELLAKGLHFLNMAF